MALDITQQDEQSTQTLGEFLRQVRLEKGIEISDIVAETKISLINIRAIEEDDYDSLPSAAFSRGLYTIYAKALQLDVDIILRRFSVENEDLRGKNNAPLTPSRLVNEVGSMAERPPTPQTSLIGMGFLTIILIVALGCWYYSVNPATYLSEKLRSFQEDTTVQNEATAELEPEKDDSYPAEPMTAPGSESALQATTNEVKTTPATATETSGQDASPRYTIDAKFSEQTTLKVTLDEKLPQQITASAGRKMSWTAEQAMEIVLPAPTTAILILNGTEVVLPKADDGKITISLPEYLFE